MATEKWIAGSGVGFTWTNAFNSGDINQTIANNNAVLSGIVIANQTALDIFCDISFDAGAAVTTVAPGYLGFYLYPLGLGTFYGDNAFTTTPSAGPPPSNYAVGSIGFPIAASTTIHGVVTGIIMPPGSFKFLLYNQAGVTLPTTGNSCQYRTYNRSVA